MRLVSKAAKRATIYTGIGAILVGTFYVVACWLVSQKSGSFAWIREIAFFLVGICLLGAMFVGVCLVFDLIKLWFGLTNVEKAGVISRLIFLVICVGVLVGALQIGESTSKIGYRAVVRRMRPVLSAIEQYCSKHSEPPAKLEDLVPEFMTETAFRSGLQGFNCVLLTNGTKEKYAGNAWILVVVISKTKSSMEMLLYYPNKNYPKSLPGFDVAWIEEWLWVNGDLRAMREYGLDLSIASSN